MPSSKQVPASIRYFKARFRTVLRPAFWGSAIAISMVLFGGWQYWQHPEWLTGSGDEATENEQSLSDESSAIGADIDSLPVLIQEFNPTNPQGAGKQKQKSQNPKEEGLFEQLTRNKTAAPNTESTSQLLRIAPKDPQNSTNPFATSAQELLNAGPLSNSGPLLGATPSNQQTETSATTATSSPAAGFKALNGDKPSQATMPGSPLQQGLNQTSTPLLSTSQPPANVSESSQATPTSTYTGQMAPPTTTTLPTTTGYSVPPTTTTNPNPNAYTSFTQPQSVPVVPVAPVPVAPPVAPIITNNYGQYPSGLPNQGSNIGTNSGFSSNVGNNSNVGNPGVQPNPVTQPTSNFPRPVTGRSLGGGRINTFTNP